MIAMCTVESVEYSFLIYYSVNLRSDVYFFRLVALLHSCLSRLFVPFGLDSGFRLAVRVHSRICCLGGDACLLSGNPKMRNPEPKKNR